MIDKKFITVVLVGIIVGAGLGYALYSAKTPVSETVEEISYQLSFDESVDSKEQDIIKRAMTAQNLAIEQPVTASVVTSEKVSDSALVLYKYVPVASIYSIRQSVTKLELAEIGFVISDEISETAKRAIVKLIGAKDEDVQEVDLETYEIDDNEVVFVPVDFLSSSVKLLEFEDDYYLDSFSTGAIIREVVFSGEGSTAFSALNINDFIGKKDVLKVNMTGVTALTRLMIRRLDVVKDPLYFSEKIGEFLSDADLTHISNEVSFKPNCTYSVTSFCSPPEFIETLKASGVGLVELTGNHNNDPGSDFNKQTIELYESLGWGTVGGGINEEDAGLPFSVDKKGSSVAFLAYNFPDLPSSGVIAGPERAGANSFDFTKIEQDILSAQKTSDFVVVNVQYWECYAYPDSYIEFPECDKPIGEQEANFKKLIDLGADMVVGSSAHQPQTYEMYKGKPIYYGLGNLYFDQIDWPGTERSIILTHYFVNGVLIQTKLTHTVYGKELQPRLMTDDESAYLLGRLYDAR